MRVTFANPVSQPASSVMPAAALALPQSQHLGFCPRSLRAAQSHESWPLWHNAINKEIDCLTSRHTWTVVHHTDVPSGICVLDSKFVFVDKPITGPKVCDVVRGDQEPKLPSSETYAPTPSATEVRLFVSAATANRREVHSMDISQAFVQSDPLAPHTHIYVRPPKGYDCPPGTLWKLRKPLYGLSCAPRAWSTTLVKFITGYGFQPVNCSSTMFTWSSGSSHMDLIYHADDILLSFNDDNAASQFKTALLQRFTGTDDGPVSRYVGLNITCDGDSMHLSQEPLALDLLDRFDMLGCNPCTTPMDAGVLLLARDRPSTPDLALRRQYQECVGTLQYLATWTRQDLQFCTNELSKHMSNPGVPHWQAAKRVLWYLKRYHLLGSYLYGWPCPL
jgi:hypothetical protein